MELSRNKILLIAFKETWWNQRTNVQEAARKEQTFKRVSDSLNSVVAAGWASGGALDAKFFEISSEILTKFDAVLKPENIGQTMRQFIPMGVPSMIENFLDNVNLKIEGPHLVQVSSVDRKLTNSIGCNLLKTSRHPSAIYCQGC